MNKLLLILAFVSTGAYAGLFGPSNLSECLDDVVKNSKNNSAAEIGAANCMTKFKSKSNTVQDCAMTWNGVSFVKGTPQSVSEYVIAGIQNTTHKVYIPKSMSDVIKDKTVRENWEQIRKICPFK